MKICLMIDNLLQNNQIDDQKSLDELQSLLYEVEDKYDVDALFSSWKRPQNFLKKILDEHLLAEKQIEKFNEIVSKNSEYWLYLNNTTHFKSIFELIAYYNSHDEQLLESLESNKIAYNFKLFNFDLCSEEKLRIAQVLKNSKIAQIRMNEILNNNLESNYEFGSLMNYLKKKEKKNILNI